MHKRKGVNSMVDAQEKSSRCMERILLSGNRKEGLHRHIWLGLEGRGQWGDEETEPYPCCFGVASADLNTRAGTQ